MLSDMIAAYVYATTKREKRVLAMKCRMRFGINKKTLDVMAEAFVEDMGYSIK